MTTTKAAVTGAAGYIGGALVAAAAESRSVMTRSIIRESAPWLVGEVVQVDDLESGIRGAIDGMDVVVHLAGPNEIEAANDPVGSINSALSALHAVTRACREARVRRLVYISTVHVYGSALAPGATVNELTTPQPRHPYSIARLAGEHLIAATAGATEVVVLRLTNSVGAPVASGVDRWSLVTNDLCRQAVTQGRLELRSDGQDWRDFIALEDVTRVILAAAESDRVPPGVYNLGSGRPMTVRQLAELVRAAASSAGLGDLELRSPAGRDEPPAPYLVDVSRLEALGLGAMTPIETAVAQTLAFCRANTVPG